MTTTNISIRHGGTYKASGNFPEQKNRCQNSVIPHYIPMQKDVVWYRRGGH